MADDAPLAPHSRRGDRRAGHVFRFPAIAAVALAVAASAAAAGAQEPDAQLPEIRTLLREKRYVPALESLRLVVLQIQELRLESLSPALPPAPGGWTARATQSLLEEDELLSSRAHVQRTYTASGPARMQISVDVRSPDAPAVAQIFNPLAVTADPTARLVELGGERALVRFNADSREGEVLVLLGRDLLVRATGSGIESPEVLVELTRRVDFPLLRSLSQR